jgi:hypothetical protein
VTDLEIFWSENRAYTLLYCIYALVVLGVAAYVERRLQLSDVATGTLAIANVAIWVLSILLFASGMLVTGWYSDLFGGEVGAFVVMLLASFAILYVAGRWCLHHFEIRLGSPSLFCALTSVALLLPYVGFHVFMFILASADWRH